MATQVKICGLSTSKTLDAAVTAGASHVGFVHFERSPRHVSLEHASGLRACLPDHVKAVLLVVDPDLPEHISTITLSYTFFSNEPATARLVGEAGHAPSAARSAP